MKAIYNRLNSNRKSGLLWYLSCLIILTFVSCDPGQMLKIENKTDSRAHIKFIFNKASQYYVFDEFGDSDTLLIQLDSTSNNSIKEYHFGIGTWEIQSSLDSLISMVELIEIETSTSKEIFKGEDQIRTFFENRITGRYKERIEIELE